MKNLILALSALTFMGVTALAADTTPATGSSATAEQPAKSSAKKKKSSKKGSKKASAKTDAAKQ